jgi:hypothetical protein
MGANAPMSQNASSRLLYLSEEDIISSANQPTSQQVLHNSDLVNNLPYRDPRELINTCIEITP